MVFTVGSRSILAGIPLASAMEPFCGLQRARRPTPKVDKPLTKQGVENLKRNKCRSDKGRAKSSAPKLTLSSTLNLAKTC